MIADLWNDGWMGRTVLLFIALIILSVPAAFVMIYVEDQEWQAFKVEHSCRVVGKVSGSTGTGIGTTISPNGGVGVGPVVVSVPGKTGWQCNDGITYWR